ncbi:hypothetical protein [Calothrix sp. UHCC 0171]|uniref:hypothetical protein n=1 Tax=Calothrix sp. UHCC 0171 TaxID=3110245 RepID=UPI002B1FFA81|nr:hypothetical protein [Calothrix sp. UHCC 0171]MEA5574236.1 hypothetical protein [Calothrix sp. UHCC 0171]
MSEHRLGKIVIERPRVGWRISQKKVTGYKKTLHKITQESIEDEGLFRPYIIKNRWRTKSFSDNLSPLRRWLRSQVNQPWDIIYSELCRKIETKTLAGQHLLFHLLAMVERDVIIIDNVPFSRRNRQIGYWGDELYIHPETGLLCLVKKISKSTVLKRDDEVVINQQTYCKINEIWYFVTYSEDTEDGIKKRQCSKKEIKLIRQKLSQ